MSTPTAPEPFLSDDRIETDYKFRYDLPAFGPIYARGYKAGQQDARTIYEAEIHRLKGMLSEGLPMISAYRTLFGHMMRDQRSDKIALALKPIDAYLEKMDELPSGDKEQRFNSALGLAQEAQKWYCKDQFIDGMDVQTLGDGDMATIGMLQRFHRHMLSLIGGEEGQGASHEQPQPTSP